MKWSRVLQRHGYPTTTENGQAYDPFQALAMQAQQSGLPPATIHYSLGAALGYGEVKCSVSVTIHCPQVEASMDLAAELAFRKGVELTNDGASHIGIPPLPVPEDT